jgi:hypothetical protein
VERAGDETTDQSDLLARQTGAEKERLSRAEERVEGRGVDGA